MASSYQANLDGTTTEPDMYEDNKDYELKEKFEEFLHQDSWTYELLESDNGGFYKYKLVNRYTDFYFIINIYLKKVVYRNRKHHEKGIQFGGGLPISERISTAKDNNELFIYLGIYKHYQEDQYLLCGWRPTEWATSDSTFNCFINVKVLADAFFWGMAPDTTRGSKSVVAFKPEFLYSYLHNIDIYHPINIPSIETDTTNINGKAQNIIFFGSPGTGKSFEADKTTGANEESKKRFVYKTTFHPEYDYNCFVGGYKPIMNENDEENKIEYKFVPQVFTNVYVEAWKNLENHYFLQIEEINRGNCAEIFGDLFQLLDRDYEGKSKYETSASEELKTHLKKEFGSSEHNGINGGKLRLPPNLSIIATMNTSDQSLFPMDSAFKRRWEWEYVPINYDCEKSSKFTIKLNNESEYLWLSFLKAVNRMILKATQSQDKQMGNWFINAENSDNIIDEKTFINKVLFYLWSDVFKDEEETIFIDNDNKLIKDDQMTYEHFFTDNTNSKLVKFLLEENLKLEAISSSENQENTE